jgi:modulator of FtsH protease HflK
VRRRRSPSEVGRLVAPLLVLIDAAWRRMHWWIALMAVLYAASGITIVKPDEVALVLRWGRLVGSATGLEEHGPGLLFVLPRPIDEVVRVKVKRVSELRVDALSATKGWSAESTLDPLSEGYALTGDRNIVRVEMMARYRIRDPADWAFYGPDPDRVLRTEVSAAMVRSLGEMGVDSVLAEGRQDLADLVTKRTQEGLDAAHSGLELTSLELTRLAPPAALAADFDAVQSAFIGAETAQKEALAYQQSAIPDAQSASDSGTQAAHASAAAQLAQARGDADAFRDLVREYRKNPSVVRERLYREAVEKAIHGSRDVRWVPPPVGGVYRGLRITVRTGRPGPTSTEEESPQ